MKNLMLLFILLNITPILAQNFLANPGFEDINTCEEFDARCAPEAWFRIPPTDLNVTSKTYRKPLFGKMSELVVVENINHPKTYRVYLYTKLLCPLIKGQEYQVSFYLNPLKKKEYEIGVLLSSYEIISGLINPLNSTPTLVLGKDHETEIDKKTKWRKLTSTFVANGDEQFLTLGNFSNESIYVDKKQQSNFFGDVIFLIDDIALTSTNPDESLCEDYDEKRTRLYHQNYRHHNKLSVDSLPPSLTDQAPPMDVFFEKPVISEEKKTPGEEVEDIPELELKEDEEKVILEIPYVAFDFDKFEIKNRYQLLLDSFAIQIKEYQPERIEFIGHTDSMGSEEYNQQLSEKRARAISEYLNKYPIIQQTPTEIIGKGELDPKATNKTMEGRQQNRRVEIVIFKTDKNEGNE